MNNKLYLTVLIPLFFYTSLIHAQNTDAAPCLTASYDTASEHLEECIKTFDDVLTSNQHDDLLEVAFKTASLHQQQGNFTASNALLLEVEKNHSELIYDFTTRHRLLRTVGINHYYLKQYSEAQVYFKKAFDLSEVQEDLLKLSQGYNDLGIVYKAQSRFADSLESYMQSLKIKETLGVEPEIGKSLNNIANAYILMGKYESAITYHQRALQLFQKLDQNDFETQEKIIHIKDQIASSLSQIGETESAINILEESIENSIGLPDSSLLLFESYCNLANIYLNTGQPERALQTLNKTELTQGISSDQELLRLEVYSAIFQANDDYTAAESVAIKGLRLAQHDKDQERISLFFRELAAIKQSQGGYQEALEYQTQFIESHESHLQQKYDTGIKFLQNEIELQIQQKNLTVLQKNNEIQELQINKQRLIVFSFILFGIFSALSVWWYLKKKASEKQRLLAQINYHRKQLEQLKAPEQKLADFFADTHEPVVCMDQNNYVSYVNQAFCSFFNVERNVLLNTDMTHTLPQFQGVLQAITFNKEDLPEQQHIEQSFDDQENATIWISVLSFLDNTLALSMQLSDSSKTEPTDVYQVIESANQIEDIVAQLTVLKSKNNDILTKDLIQQIDHKLKLADSGEDDLSAIYRKSMVDLMNSNLEVWRKNTQGDRISLAEKSKVWKVTIDDGRLRTRAMDRYLNLKSLPKTPRWRSVVKTSHYILAECSLNYEQRKYLNDRLEIFMTHLKAHSNAI
ncbi:tetratricopeptide repeat protein [Marinicella sp. W31]|uniref:tetratricopeptide repeat protein n=1 Tax=Marinicella sp. W31 TaxID=3023713 RepID=UPI0037584B5A